MAHGYPDFEGDKSGLYLMPEWAAFEAIDINLSAFVANRPWNFTLTSDYVVTAGRTLYITSASCKLSATLQADADNNHFFSYTLQNTTTGIILAYLGGNGGGQLIFPKPITIPAGETYRMALTIMANHNCNPAVASRGYEI